MTQQYVHCIYIVFLRGKESNATTNDSLCTLKFSSSTTWGKKKVLVWLMDSMAPRKLRLLQVMWQNKVSLVYTTKWELTLVTPKHCWKLSMTSNFVLIQNNTHRVCVFILSKNYVELYFRPFRRIIFWKIPISLWKEICCIIWKTSLFHLFLEIWTTHNFPHFPMCT